MNAHEMEFLRLFRQLSPEKRRAFVKIVHLLLSVRP